MVYIAPVFTNQKNAHADILENQKSDEVATHVNDSSLFPSKNELCTLLPLSGQALNVSLKYAHIKH